MTDVRLQRDEIAHLAEIALIASGADQHVAKTMGAAISAAECDGIPSHGLAYLPTYCLHLECGKIAKRVTPTRECEGAVVRVNAKNGFAHPAIDVGFEALIPLASQHGIAALAVSNSYNCGVLSYHAEKLGRSGLVGLAFTNAPASMAAWGASQPILGTNPWSLAVPDGKGGIAILIDQSASVVAKSEVMKYEREGKILQEGWALDAEGRPTTDPALALQGTMVPAGGYKGVGTSLLVEVFAACLTGSNSGTTASPFSGSHGGPPGTGQFFIAVDPAATSNGSFGSVLEIVLRVFSQSSGARLPGVRRLATRRHNVAQGILIRQQTYEKAVELASRTPLP